MDINLAVLLGLIAILSGYMGHREPILGPTNFFPDHRSLYPSELHPM